MLTLKVLSEYVITDSELFWKKIAKFQEEKKNWENISSHFDTVFSFGAVIFSIFLQFRQHFRNVKPINIF
jgi:hypothetical protein